MKLSEEYKRQRIFRDWESYIEPLPLSNQEIILDLGCGIGDVTGILAKEAYKVIGIDNDSELLQEAEIINSADNIVYINMDLRAVKYENLPVAAWTATPATS